MGTWAAASTTTTTRWTASPSSSSCSARPPRPRSCRSASACSPGCCSSHLGTAIEHHRAQFKSVPSDMAGWSDDTLTAIEALLADPEAATQERGRAGRRERGDSLAPTRTACASSRCCAPRGPGRHRGARGQGRRAPRPRPRPQEQPLRARGRARRARGPDRAGDRGLQSSGPGPGRGLAGRLRRRRPPHVRGARLLGPLRRARPPRLRPARALARDLGPNAAAPGCNAARRLVGDRMHLLLHGQVTTLAA